MYKYFLLRASFCCSINIYTTDVLLCVEAAILFHPLPMMSKKEAAGQDACDLFCHRFRPCSWRQWHRPLGTKWSFPRWCFHDFQTSIFNTQESRITGNLNLWERESKYGCAFESLLSIYACLKNWQRFLFGWCAVTGGKTCCCISIKYILLHNACGINPACAFFAHS